MSLLSQTLDAFERISVPEVTTSDHTIFSTTRFPDSKYHLIGKDSNGNPAVLLNLSPSQKPVQEPSIRLEHLLVQAGVYCKVSDASDVVRRDLFTVVICTSQDEQLVQQFFLLVGSLVVAFVERPSVGEAAAAIHRTIELFQVLATVGTRTVQGLWGELFVIRASSHPDSLVRAWRLDQSEQFDFSESNMRLEVKTTQLPRRVHRFSFEQIAPRQPVICVIASMRTRGVANGLTIQRLWDEVRTQLSGDAELLLRLDRVVTTSLGISWRNALTTGFDEELAQATLTFYSSEEVPRIAYPVPEEVTNIKFDSDVTESPSLDVSELISLGSLFAAASIRN